MENDRGAALRLAPEEIIPKENLILLLLVAFDEIARLVHEKSVSSGQTRSGFHNLTGIKRSYAMIAGAAMSPCHKDRRFINASMNPNARIDRCERSKRADATPDRRPNG